jgi:multiple inositol-polyphosphate phosphatase/2,3-bisphosphoglycerate 3-phosphatase
MKLATTVQNYSSYINDSFSWIKNWKSPFVLTQQGFLSYTGQEELYHMGIRYNLSYPSLFSLPYSTDVYVMQSTQVPRTGMSASSFSQGYLQGRGNIGPSNFQPAFIFSDTPADDVLRFFDNCPQYTQAMDNGTINANEYSKYVNLTYPSIATRVAQTLGVAPYWQITTDQLDSMFTACAFEVAVFNKTDGWCALFSPSDISTFEYANDLDNYWIKSYGTSLGSQIGSVVLQNVVATIDGVISNALPTQKAYLRFAHAETIIPLSAVLGLFKDNYTLTANLSQELIDNRVWSTSFVSPFGANLAFALYSCDNSVYYIKLTVNEVETAFPGCEAIYCPYTQFKTIYAQALAFNYTDACALPTTPTTPTQQVSVVIFSATVTAAFVLGALLVFIFSFIYIRRVKNIRYTALSTSSN